MSLLRRFAAMTDGLRQQKVPYKLHRAGTKLITVDLPGLLVLILVLPASVLVAPHGDSLKVHNQDQQRIGLWSSSISSSGVIRQSRNNRSRHSPCS